MNSKQKGGVGVAAAISYFAKRGDLVYSPITESGCDLIIDRGGRLLRVEVKSSWHKKGIVDLRNSSGYYTAKGVSQPVFNGHSVDILVAYNGDTDSIQEFKSVDMHGRSTVTVR